MDPHLAAALSAAPSFVTYAAQTDLTGASAHGTRGSLHLSVQTAGSIPRSPDELIGAVAVFAYSCRDSNQNPDGWHSA